MKTGKTAGTSTEAFLARNLWPRSSCADGAGEVHLSGFAPPHPTFAHRRKSRAYRGKLAAMCISHGLAVSRVPDISQLGPHAGQKQIQSALGKEFFDTAMKIVNVRNPYDLVVSAYSFFTSHKNLGVTFDEFVLDHFHRNPLRPGYSLVRDLDESYRIIRFESLESDLIGLTHELNIRTVHPFPAKKQGYRSPEHRDYRGLYSQVSRHKVKDEWADWIDAFAYSF